MLPSHGGDTGSNPVRAFMKVAEQAEARRMREGDGLSVRDIANRLGVSRSSVSTWVRDIVLSDEQVLSLNTHDPQSAKRRAGAEANRSKGRARRQSFQLEGREAAREGDARHAAACMLFWGEGTKKRNSAIIANSDVQLLFFWISFLREHFAVESDEICIRCHIHQEHETSVVDAEDFWLAALCLPRSSLRASVVDQRPRSSKGKRVSVHRYGVCTVEVHKTQIVQHLYGAIQEYGGFTREEWLN